MIKINKDITAFKSIYDTYWEELYTKAYKRLNSREEAEDIVQNIFVEFWRNLEKIEIEKSVGDYLHGALKNKILQYYRTQFRQSTYTKNASLYINEIDETVENKIIYSDLLNKIDHIAGYLPKKSKKVYELKQKRYLTNKEISKALDISEKTVEYHVKYVTDFLKNYCGDVVIIVFLLLV